MPGFAAIELPATCHVEVLSEMTAAVCAVKGERMGGVCIPFQSALDSARRVSVLREPSFAKMSFTSNRGISQRS